MLGRNVRYLIELRAVRSLFGRCVGEGVSIELVSCKENVRRNVRYLIELRAVRSLLEEIPRYSIKLVAVRRMLVEI